MCYSTSEGMEIIFSVLSNKMTCVEQICLLSYSLYYQLLVLLELPDVEISELRLSRPSGCISPKHLDVGLSIVFKNGPKKASFSFGFLGHNERTNRFKLKKPK